LADDAVADDAFDCCFGRFFFFFLFFSPSFVDELLLFTASAGDVDDWPPRGILFSSEERAVASSVVLFPCGGVRLRVGTADAALAGVGNDDVNGEDAAVDGRVDVDAAAHAATNPTAVFVLDFTAMVIIFYSCRAIYFVDI